MLVQNKKAVETPQDVFQSTETIILQSIFSLLNSTNISYAVMRNHETLPYSSGGSDLDILVAKEDATKTAALLNQAITQAGGKAIGLARTVDFFKVYTFGKHASHPEAWWGQRIDVNVGLVFKGIPLLDDGGWSSLTRRHNGIVVLSDGIAGVLGVLKEVLNNSRLPSRYLPAAKAAAEREWGLIAAALQPMGSEALGLLHKLITSCVKDDEGTLQSLKLQNALIAHAMRRRPFISLWRRFLCWWSMLQRYASPSGTVIAILGVDGAGKSTVINAIKPVLDLATHNATFVHHLRPELLPPLARLISKRKVSSGPVLDPHGSIPSGTIGSLLRLIYLTFDYILGYWLRTRLQIAKQPAIVLFDRYAYDMALDPRRFRIGLPGWVAGLFARCVPRPDLIICLYADPEIIAARKQELSLEETRRQVEALQIFAKTQTNAVLISTEGSVEEVRERVLRALFDFFDKRKGS